MNPQKEMEKRLAELEKKVNSLYAVSTIPLNVDRSFQARGFVKTDFFVAGIGQVDGGGVYQIPIPGATKTSVPLITPYTGGTTVMTASLQPIDSGYELYVEGAPGDIFHFVVFLLPQLYKDSI